MPAYTEEDMQNALRAIEAGKARGITAIKYGIPLSTLRQRLAYGIKIETENGKRLSDQEEAQVRDWILSRAAFDSAPSNREIREYAASFPAARGDDKPLAASWIEGFIRRQPELEFLKYRVVARDERAARVTFDNMNAQKDKDDQAMNGNGTNFSEDTNKAGTVSYVNGYGTDVYMSGYGMDFDEDTHVDDHMNDTEDIVFNDVDIVDEMRAFDDTNFDDDLNVFDDINVADGINDPDCIDVPDDMNVHDETATALRAIRLLI